MNRFFFRSMNAITEIRKQINHKKMLIDKHLAFKVNKSVLTCRIIFPDFFFQLETQMFLFKTAKKCLNIFRTRYFGKQKHVEFLLLKYEHFVLLLLSCSSLKN